MVALLRPHPFADMPRMPRYATPCHRRSPLQELHIEAGSAGGSDPPLLNKDNAERALMARLRCLPPV